MKNTENNKRAPIFLKAESQQMIIQKGKKAEENYRERMAKMQTAKVGLRVRPAMLVALKILFCQ